MIGIRLDNIKLTDDEIEKEYQAALIDIAESEFPFEITREEVAMVMICNIIERLVSKTNDMKGITVLKD